MLLIRPAAAHRVTVLGSTRNVAATSPGVSSLSAMMDSKVVLLRGWGTSAEQATSVFTAPGSLCVAAACVQESARPAAESVRPLSARRSPRPGNRTSGNFTTSNLQTDCLGTIDLRPIVGGTAGRCQVLSQDNLRERGPRHGRALALPGHRRPD